MYGAMVYGLYVVVVLVCVVVKSMCGLLMMYCVLLYGCPLCCFVVVRMGFNVFECVSVRELACDVVWFVCLLCVCVYVCLCFIFDVSYLVMMYGLLCFVCVNVCAFCVCVVCL